MTEPRIYVACLASYNNGRLYGRWIEATTDAAEMGREIADMLAGSPYPNVMRQRFKCEVCKTSRIVTLSEFSSVTVPECPECGDPMTIDGEPFKSAEEWAIHDYEGLGPDLGEYAGLDEVARRVSIVELAAERDIPAPVLLEYANDYMSGEWDANDLDSALDDAFDGSAETWREFVEERIEDAQDMSEVPEWLQYHIDWDSIARDWQISGDWSAYRDGEGGTLYFFRSH